MEKGRLIVFEGACDGIGKSTQFDELVKHLGNDGYDVVNHHFPSYGTYHGAPVEEYLKGNLGKVEELSPYLINGLYALDRGITWQTILKKAYDDGKIILLDRYTTSSLIYQSALIEDISEKKKFIDYVIDFEYKRIGTKEPDSVIFLYAPFELVTKMRNGRKHNDGVANDIHESNFEFMKKVYDNAMFVAKYLSWDMIDCSSNNEMRSIEDIHNEVYQVVIKKMVKTR